MSEVRIKDDCIIIKDLKDDDLRFKNFSGKVSRYNQNGDRTFAIILPEDCVSSLQDAGWYIKFLAARNDDEQARPYIQVTVSFKKYPPKIYTVTENNMKRLDEQDVGELDWADISKIDLTIRPYNWEVNGNKGIKAYVKTMYVTLFQDELALEYDNMSNGIPFA